MSQSVICPNVSLAKTQKNPDKLDWLSLQLAYQSILSLEIQLEVTLYDDCVPKNNIVKMSSMITEVAI